MLNKIKAIWKKYKGYLPSLLVSLAIPLAVGMLSALLTKNNMSIYNEIKTPPLSPPPDTLPHRMEHPLYTHGRILVLGL